MRIITTLVASTAAFAIAGASALAETKTYDITGFDSIKATQGVEVIVEVGSAYSITLETSGDVDKARVEQDGDTLILGRKSKGARFNLGRSARYQYTVTMPSIEAASSSAGAELEVSGISGDDVRLSASSGSELEAEGSCGSLRVRASSGAAVEASDLACDNVVADVSSGADIEVHASSSVDADASSGGSIVVHGNPGDRSTDKSSGGRVRFAK
ncbi:MAG: DUF2807 domain-containing protein [Pseudomonadota bacterium]